MPSPDLIIDILREMGSSESKEPPKMIDSTGNVNNNVIIQDTVSIHNDHMVIVLYVIAAIKILELLYILFKMYNKSNKKKYLQRGITLSKV